MSFLVLEGNHDISFSLVGKKSVSSPNRLPATCMVAGWTIGHGHRPIAGARTISGHHHPVFRCQGIAAPCFLVGPGRIVLPAFSSNAAGCDVVSAGRSQGMACRFSSLPGEHRRRSARFWTACPPSPPARGAELLDLLSDTRRSSAFRRSGRVRPVKR